MSEKGEGMFETGIMLHSAAVWHSDQHGARACEWGKMGSDSPQASRNVHGSVCGKRNDTNLAKLASNKARNPSALKFIHSQVYKDNVTDASDSERR